MKKMILLTVFLMACATTEQPKEDPKGACSYSWYNNGWQSYCYSDYTESTCDAMKGGVYNASTVWVKSSSCAALGFTVKCSRYWKNSVCQSWE